MVLVCEWIVGLSSPLFVCEDGGVATVTPFLFISLFCLSGWMGWPPPTTVILFCDWVLGCPLFVPFPYCFYVCLMGDGWPPSSCLGVRWSGHLPLLFEWTVDGHLQFLVESMVEWTADGRLTSN